MSALLGWGLALGSALVIASIAYPAAAKQGLRPLLAALRLAAVIIIAALVLDLPIGVARPPIPLVALDVSASWLRTGDSAGWSRARDSAAAALSRGGELLLFGDSTRQGALPTIASDPATLVGPAVRLAVAAGRPVVIVTDGGVDDSDALQQAVAGSRVVVVPVGRAADRAIIDISAPGEARVGDTVNLLARVVADGSISNPTSLRWSLGDTRLGDSPVPALAEGSEAVVEIRVVVPAGDSAAVLRAALAVGGDAFPRNDTVGLAFRRDVRQRVVIVSTAPDADIRDVATALRANVALPTDAYFRIAPGRWLREGELMPVEESAVRAAVRGASLAVLHGDTSAVGAPASLGTRALLLLSPPGGDARELLVRTAPSSPLQGALAGMMVESLPPLLVAQPARGGLVALNAAPGTPTSGATPIVTAIDGDVRRVVVTAAGYSRWRARGGVSQVAFHALIGGATDWLLGARGRAAAATLFTPLTREGSEIRWRRGANAWSIVALTREGDRLQRRDSVVFGANPLASMPALDAGVWRGTVDAVPVLIPVSAAKEWLPRALTVRSGVLNGEAATVRRSARTLEWLYLAGVLLLAAEWLLRRRAGLR